MAYLIELTAPRVVGVREYETPKPAAGEVVIRTLFSGISAGTEIATYRGTNPYQEKRWDPEAELFFPGGSTFSYPLDVWGYSEVGEVTGLGKGAEGLAVGEVVWGIWGHRSHAALPAARLIEHQLSAHLDPIVGTFDRVGAVALNAVFASNARVGESVAIFGQGVIGLLATQLLVNQGIDVYAVDAIPGRLALARQFGATPILATEGDVAVILREHTRGRGVDRVIELSGVYAALQAGIRVAGVGGTVVAGGFYQGAADSLRLGEEFHHNRVSLVTSQIGALPHDLAGRWSRERLHQTVMKLCSAGRLDPAPLVSHIFPARDAAAAYAMIDRPPSDLLQVILDFRSSPVALNQAA